MSDFYIKYNIKNLDIVSVSGSPFDSLEEDTDCAFINEDDGSDLILGKKSMYNFFVLVKDGYAILKSKQTRSFKGRNSVTNEFIRDLNFSSMFFDRCKILWTVKDSRLILKFDEENFENFLEYRTLVRETTQTLVYVTKFKDPNYLLSKHSFKLYELDNGGKVELDCDYSDSISLYGVLI
jgi:hypothetical protein